MLRDRDCNKRFERNLLHYVNLAKIAARKMHNNRMTNYVNSRAEDDFNKAILEIVGMAYHD